jgi:hypothetical protein
MSKLIVFGWYGGKYSHLEQNFMIMKSQKTTHKIKFFCIEDIQEFPELL